MATDSSQGGLYQLTKGAVQGLKRDHWGVKITFPVEFDPQTGKPTKWETHDTAVQNPIDELVSRLADDGPIQLSKSLTLIAPANAPAITIINGDGGGDQFGFTGTLTFLAGVNIDMSSLTIDTSGLGVNTSGLSVTAGTLGVSISVSACTATATVTGAPALSGSATITGTATLVGTPTITYTYVTITFQNGFIVSVS